MSDDLGTERPLRIHEGRDGEREFILHPEDDDLFVRSGRQVIQSCQLGINLELWMHELKAAAEKVASWAESHASQLRACWLTPRGGKITFFFAPSSGRFDFDLAEELSALHTELLNDFKLGMIEVYQIPESDADRFMSHGEARLLYGEERQPHQAVDA